MTTPLAAAALSLALLLTVAACSDGDDPSDPAPSLDVQPTEPVEPADDGS